MSTTKFLLALSAATLALLFASSAAAQQNLLVNGDFEADVMPSYGNNTSITSITGWLIDAGVRPNLVRVDGPGGQGANYSGPASDGSMAGPGVTRQYYDHRESRATISQIFEATCTGTVEFGGAFSGRGPTGQGAIFIQRGTSLGGPNLNVGPVLSADIPAGDPRERPWQLVSGNAQLVQGETYRLWSSMNNDTNLDEVFVRYTDRNCQPNGPSNPWVLEDVMDEAVATDINFSDIYGVPDGDHYQCYMINKARPIAGESIQIEDQFGKSEVLLGQPVMLCNPSAKTHKGERFEIEDERRHLVCYDYVKQGRVESHELVIETQFGRQEVVSSRRELFCAPASKTHR